MKINGKKYPTLAVFPNMMTVPDCFVASSNKIGKGHGEAKFYIGPKDEMYDFYGEEGFKAKCFMLKNDLISYMEAIKNEYLNPSQDYAQKNKLPQLWNERLKMINDLDDIIFFDIQDQNQISGVRGYINSKDLAYDIIRKISLPLVSYIYVEKIENQGKNMFYWKLFVDFEAIWQKQNDPLVFTYGKKKDELQKETKKEKKKKEEISYARDGQGKYREKLLEQCHYCPFTMISDERLLIASHIKPWAASNEREKTDPYNGYMLSPLYDKLFDRGFITFTSDRHIILSDFISSYTWKKIGLKNNTFIKNLPMDEKRKEYLKFHHKSVFKGSYEFED
ncbi:HNH endonuclease [Peptacetobacter sp.]|uniref:HNH endonuclease n=1 Tax=Peptacetobacter sp. TaxID=2991975 RepID=UPI003AB4CEA4